MTKNELKKIIDVFQFKWEYNEIHYIVYETGSEFFRFNVLKDKDNIKLECNIKDKDWLKIIETKQDFINFLKKKIKDEIKNLKKDIKREKEDIKYFKENSKKDEVNKIRYMSCLKNIYSIKIDLLDLKIFLNYINDIDKF